VKPRAITVAAALLGATGVALGAFGAHALAGVVRAERLATFETAVRYHLVHAVALLAVAALAERRPRVATAAAPLVAGIVIFSGSLYALVLTDVGAFGMTAPVGGALLVAGWALVAWASWRGDAA
jgi:uncharacterized membrane protein YgdD (TMEM256/DUF423 family)